MRKVTLLLSFFVFAPFLLVLTLVLAMFTTYNDTKTIASVPASPKPPVAYAALPSGDVDSLTIELIPKDARVETVRQFLERYNSPLEPYAQDLVSIAQKYGLDHRLLPAIAMQESNLCKKVRSDSAHNCWGWGIHSGKGLAFESYPEAIKTIARGLSTKYKDKHGLTTPEEIEKRYNPNSTGSWAFSVNHFMSQML